ncbi:hypothetical protein EAH68_01025 [Corynebacterium hylobatis]|uniref:Uncharacterized protein n=1 Tax=Corynebacterium hylobatis TaxID=1859290 RepID=A0A3S0B6B0_9CORY|nr:hypothetical protein [Corynebacterium hylobatis]RSZ66164.1 hypothetical protein EAH68_01025 [Corynebacterium hylobatis]
MTTPDNAPESAPRSEFDDPRRPLLRAVRFGTIALVVITIISLAIWGGVRELPGIWGVLIGAAIGGGFVLLTAASVLFTSSTNPATTGAVVLGSWLLKVVVLLVVLFLIRDLTFYDRTALLVTTVVALIIVLATEVWGVITARVTYVN